MNAIEDNDISDLMLCLKEICIIFITPADNLVKVRK
jgi:hypothetical protein